MDTPVFVAVFNVAQEVTGKTTAEPSFWSQVEWLNAVAVPVLLAFLLGIPLSMYTAYVLGRWMSFKQALNDALFEVATYSLRTVRAQSKMMFELGLGELLVAPAMKLANDDQRAARIRMLEIGNIGANGMRELLKEIAPPPDGDFQKDVTGSEWIQTAAWLTREFQPVRKVMMNEIAAMRPSIWAILGKKPEPEKETEQQTAPPGQPHWDGQS